MADEPPPTYSAHFAETEIPLEQKLSQDVLDAWNALPGDREMTRPLLKRDVDALLNTLSRLLYALTSSQLSNTAAIKGDLNLANNHLGDYRAQITEAYHAYVDLLAGIMKNELGLP